MAYGIDPPPGKSAKMPKKEREKKSLHRWYLGFTGEAIDQQNPRFGGLTSSYMLSLCPITPSNLCSK
jgi:hypothetical protein